MTERLSTTERLSALQTLVTLSRADLMYADQYLRRARILLQPLCTEEQYAHMARQRRRLPEASAELERAASAGDWKRVRSLAEAAERVKQQIASETQVLAIGDMVYGPHTAQPDAQSLGLTGVVTGPSASLEKARQSLIDGLHQLAKEDEGWADFYRTRIAHFEKTRVATDDAEGPVLDPAHLKIRLQEAIRQGHFPEVRRLADALASDPQSTGGRIRIPAPVRERVRRLAESFPEAVAERAAGMGLASETLPAEASLNGYLSCCCADRARFPDSPLSDEHRRAEGCTCGHECPPQLSAPLRDALDLLIVHPFITSTGTRYLPWFGEEKLLVETFPEDGPESNVPLLKALGLPRRQGLPRIRIEDALGSRGPALCTDLGLDPMDCVAICIPFDTYLRLAPKYGWGRQPRWTHFDGYQLLRDTHLRALVGGDERYGGASDLCSVERYYDPEHLLARFAIVRRDRFTVREPEEI